MNDIVIPMYVVSAKILLYSTSCISILPMLDYSVAIYYI